MQGEERGKETSAQASVSQATESRPAGATTARSGTRGRNPRKSSSPRPNQPKSHGNGAKYSEIYSAFPRDVIRLLW